MRVYKYGLLPPTQNADLVHEQIKAAHHYRNKLVELELERRTTIRAPTYGDPDVQTAEAEARETAKEVAVLHGAVANANSQHRSKSKTDKDLKKELAAAKKAHNKNFTVLHKARNKVLKAHEAEKTEANTTENTARKKERKGCGVFWGTYQVVEDAMKASAKQSYWDGIEPNDPRFVRFKGTGRVSVQIQAGLDGGRGMDAADVFKDDTRLQIDPVDEAAWFSPSRSERRKKSRTTLRMRIGSQKKRAPIWAEWPMIMHRPLPDDSRIKRATVNLRRIGPRDEWSVDFFVDDRATLPLQNGAVGSVGLDVGWRQMDDGSVRVACWHGEDEQTGELRISADLIGALRRADTLQSTRKQNFNEALADAVQHFQADTMPLWMRKLTGKKDRTPTKAQACAYLSQWKAAARLAALTKRWEREGVDKQHQAAYEALEAWRYHDFHLWRWEADQRKKAERRRKDEYRNFAAVLARQYSTLILEDFKLNRIVKKQGVDEDTDNQRARGNRKLASISELRDVLRNAFEKSGAVQLVKAADTTRICAACGALNTFDAAQNLEHRCDACGVLWDQDRNASKVILRRGLRDSQSVSDPLHKEELGNKLS